MLEWLYGLFLGLLSFCAEALTGIMGTDLSFFETSVPVVPQLYRIFTAVGWGVLIGNLAFQSLKAMMAGLGFETESPAILLIRTALFGTLLVVSGDVCDIVLIIGGRIITLLGLPESVRLTLPDESFFTGSSIAWLLAIIIGFILGFQLLRFFFEIAERYVVLGVLTLLMPVGLALGGSKSTKDICTGFMRTYASMTAMTVLNVLFLKLIISALSTIPAGYMIIPWCLLVVGIARTARKADSLLSKIGLNPAFTGDPLGAGRGLAAASVIARTVMSFTGRAGRGLAHSGRNGAAAHKNAAYNRSGGTNVSGRTDSSSVGNTAVSSSGNSKTAQTNNFSGNSGGSANYSFGGSTSGGAVNRNTTANTAAFSGGKAETVNTNRFGAFPDHTVKNPGKNTQSAGQSKAAPAVQKNSGRNIPDSKKPYNRSGISNQNNKARFGSEAPGKSAVKNKTGFSKPELFGGRPVKPDDVSEAKPDNEIEKKEDNKNE